MFSHPPPPYFLIDNFPPPHTHSKARPCLSGAANHLTAPRRQSTLVKNNLDAVKIQRAKLKETGNSLTGWRRGGEKGGRA